jgi:NitT/TauT family transport system substrate-binding protein
MRPWQRRLLLSLVTVAMSWPAAAPASAEPIVLKVGISEPVNTVLAIWMADAAGFYEANGIKVEIVNMNGGSRGATELAAGRIDAMHVGLSSVVRLNRSGGDLRIIASLANVIRFTFFSGPSVKTAADLKGGVVGVSSFGSESDSTVTLALKRLGLSRDDVTLKEYGAGTKRLAAVKSGEIKATAVNEPFSSMAREQGFNVLFDLVPEQIPWLFTAIVVRRGDIAGRRDVLTRFIRATAEGNYLALTDEKRAKAVLAKQAGITDPKILDITYNDFKLLSPPNIEPSAAAAKNILAQFPDASQKPEDYVDAGILDTLRKDGVFTVLAQKYQR